MRNLKCSIDVKVRMLTGNISNQIEIQIDHSQLDANGADLMEMIYILTMLRIDTLARPLMLQCEVMKLG